MGGAAKAIVSVAIAVAIPFVAPAWGATLAKTLPSWGLSATTGAVAVGAGLGAASAAVGGRNVLRGAIGGGIAGGASSYFGGGGGGGGGAAPTPTPPPTPTAVNSNIGQTLYTGGPGITPVDYSLTAPTVAPTALTPSTIPLSTPVDYGLTSGFAAPAGAFGETALGSGLNVAGAQPTFSSVGFQAAGSTGLDLGAQLSAPAAAAGSPYTLTSNAMPAAAGVPSAAAPTAGLATPTSLTAGGATPTLSAMPTAAAAPAATTAAVTGAAPAAAATVPLTAGQKAWEFTKSIGGDLLKTAAVIYALGAGNVPGEIPEEQMIMYQQELQRLAEQNPAAYQAQLQEAQKFLQMASTFDPQYFGEEEARKAQIRGARAKRESLRGLTGRERAAAERKFDLETGRSSGTSFTQGAQRALTSQLQTTEAGLKLMPRPSDYSSLSSLQNLGNVYQKQATARRQYAQDIGALADIGAGIYEKGRSIYDTKANT